MIEEEFITRKVVLSSEELFIKYKKIYTESKGYTVLSEFKESDNRYILVVSTFWSINE